MPLCDRGDLDTRSFWTSQEVERSNEVRQAGETFLFIWFWKNVLCTCGVLQMRNNGAFPSHSRWLLFSKRHARCYKRLPRCQQGMDVGTRSWRWGLKVLAKSRHKRN